MKIGLGSLLFVLFLALKLCHVIAWSWLWVTAPLWGGTALWLLVVGGCLAVAAVMAALDRR